MKFQLKTMVNALGASGASPQFTMIDEMWTLKEDAPQIPQFVKYQTKDQNYKFVFT